MDARERLRRYLEQRRDMGESEFVLDSLPLDEALRLIGDTGSTPARDATSHGAASAPTESAGRDRVPSPRDRASDGSTNWREALSSIGAGAPTVREPSAGEPSAVEPSAAPAAPIPGTGIIVGSADRELLAGPLSALTTLDDVARHVRECTGCSLYKTARNAVPGEGNPHASFVCVGEAPGQTEDELGRPFVGRAGDLLTKILDAIQLKREDVFICNVLKHRPPGNRNPAPDEIRACSPYLLRQLELLQPKVILALGTFASQTLLQTTQPLGKLRGLVHRFHGVPLIVTYHPAALLRNPAWKRPTWEDVQLARRIHDSAAQG